MTTRGDNQLKIKREIIETIRLIREYIRNRLESLPSEIRERIERILEEDAYKKALVVYSDIGQNLFHNLQLYIRARYNYLEELLRFGLLSTKKPLFGLKIIFDNALSGNFPASSVVRIQGITWKALAKSIMDIKKHSIVFRSKRVLIRKDRRLPDTLQYIIRKRELINIFEKKLIDEVREADGETCIENLISPTSRPISPDSIMPRIFALLKLLKEEKLKIIEKEGKSLVRLV